MKLKFYFIGFGIGVIVTAVIMGIALGNRRREMTDEEVMIRARQLGMIESVRLTDEDNQISEDSGAGNEAAPQETEAQEAAVEGNAGSGTGTYIESVRGADGSAEGGNETGEEDALFADARTADEDGETDEASEEGGETSGSGDDGSAEGSASPENGSVITGRDVTGDSSAAGETNASEDGTDETASAESNSSEEKDEAEDDSSAADNSGNSSSGNSGRQQAAGSIVVTIPDGVYSEDICSLLQTAGAIDNATSFNAFLVSNGQDRYITPGARLIPRGASYEEVASIITGH